MRLRIKENITRLSFWTNNERFCKIEKNKLFITNGYSKHNKELWNILYFDKIEDGIELFNTVFVDLPLSTYDEAFIKDLYRKLK
jgi:hypothetical protein